MIHKIKVKENSRLSQILFFREIDLDTLPNPRIVPLFGANGAGKTSLLKGIAQEYSIKARIKYLLAKKDGKDMQRQQSIAEISPDLKTANKGKSDHDFWDEEIEKVKMGSELEIMCDNIAEVLLNYRNSDDNLKVRKARSLSEEFDPAFIRDKFNACALSEGQSVIFSLSMLLDALKPGRCSLIGSGENGIVLLDEVDSGLSIDNLDSVLRKIKKITAKRGDVQVFLSFNTSYVLKHFPDVISLYDGLARHIGSEAEMVTEIMKNKKMLDKARKTSRGSYKIFD